MRKTLPGPGLADSYPRSLVLSGRIHDTCNDGGGMAYWIWTYPLRVDEPRFLRSFSVSATMGGCGPVRWDIATTTPPGPRPWTHT